MNLLLKSTGFKRRVSALLSVILGMVSMIPGSGVAVAAIQYVASFFGVTGFLHAAKAGTVGKEKLGTIVAVINSLILILHFVPGTEAVVGHLQYLATILGAALLGRGVGVISSK